MKLFLALALILSALPGLAGDAANPVAGEPGARMTVKKAHPDLLRLEQELTRKLDDKKDGRVTPEQYQAWKAEFLARLEATMARIPPSPDNTAAHARITAQLGEREQAQATLNQALEQNPESPILLRTKGQILYEQNDFPGAAHHGLQAWEKSGRTDQKAWALYQMSKGRSAPSGTTSSSPGLAPLTQGPPVVPADGSNKPIKLAVRGRALPSLVPALGQNEAEPIKREGGLPLWPLAVPIAGGLIAYGLYRGTKKADAQESEQPAVGALLTAPGLVAEPANIAGGVIRTAAKGAAIETLGDIAVTGIVAAGILVAGGAAVIVTVNHGLNQMISAQDKYNEAIDTHKPSQGTFNTSTKGIPESRGNENDCSLKKGEDILGKFLDGTRLAPGYLRQHEGPNKGHTLRDHVSQKLPDLARQIKAGKRNASSYPDVAIAEDITRRAIENNRALVEAWFARRTQARQPTPYTGSHLLSIGYTISEQNPSVPMPKYDAIAILQKAPNCRILILTSYPQ